MAILQEHHIITNDYKWNFGKNQLVVIGDVFDRGTDVVPIYWLIYKLQDEAEKAAGGVHYLLGNHEESVMKNSMRFSKKKYHDLALVLGMPYSELWTDDSELGRWVRSRNAIEVIDDNLFVHGGLSKEFLDRKLGIGYINKTFGKNLLDGKKKRPKDDEIKFLFGSNGPLRYRGMVLNDDKSNPIKEKDVEKLLKHFGLSHIVVGHTIFPEISNFHNGKVITLNVRDQKNRETKKSRAAIITKNGIFRVYDDPSRVEKVAK